MPIDPVEQRRREARQALLVFVAALDDTPLHDVGEWLVELGEALQTGGPIPGADEAAAALTGNLFDEPRGNA